MQKERLHECCSAGTKKPVKKSKPVGAEIRKPQGTVEYMYHRLETIRREDTEAKFPYKTIK